MFDALFTRRKRHQHSDAPDLYQYQAGVYPHPSAAQTAVFEPLQTLPVFLFRGSGSVPRASLDVTENGQVYVNPGITQAGLGGLQFGTLEFQPLIDPYEGKG